MAATSLSHTLLIALQRVAYPGAALAADPEAAISVSGTHTERTSGRHYLEGSATTTITPPSLPAAGAKLVLIFYESGSAVITVNGIELSSGGLLLISDPTPTNGETSFAVVHTADATLRVVVLA